MISQGLAVLSWQNDLLHSYLSIQPSKREMDCKCNSNCFPTSFGFFLLIMSSNSSVESTHDTVVGSGGGLTAQTTVY